MLAPVAVLIPTLTELTVANNAKRVCGLKLLTWATLRGDQSNAVGTG